MPLQILTIDQKIAKATYYRALSQTALSPWAIRAARSQMRFYALSFRVAAIKQARTA